MQTHNITCTHVILCVYHVVKHRIWGWLSHTYPKMIDYFFFSFETESNTQSNIEDFEKLEIHF